MKKLPLFRLAWRNVWRNTRRTIITIAALTVAATAMVWFRALIDGMMEDIVASNIQNGMGHVVVQPTGFEKNPLVDKYLHDPKPMESVVAAEPMVKAWSPRIEARGLASSPENSMGTSIYGVEPQMEKGISAYYKVMTGGDWFQSADENGVIIGTKMAEVLNVDLGDLIAVLVQNLKGEVAAEAYPVVGIMHTGMPNLDNNLVLMPLKLAQKQIGYGDDYSKIVIIAGDSTEVPKLKQALAAKINATGVEVKTWEELYPMQKQMSELVDASMVFFMFLLVILASFGMINTILMSVLERINEFGMMSALGMRPGQVFRLIMYESVVLAFFGTLCGLAVGAGLSYFNSIYGIDLTAFAGSIKALGLTNPIITLVLKPAAFVSASLTVFIISVLSAIYPAVKAARLRPMAAIHRV
jgi:ABC-type lipoprotein release transport system permease subunit